VTCNTNKFNTQNVTPSTPTINGKPYCSAIGGGLVWTNNPTTTPCIMVSYSVVTSTYTYATDTTAPICPPQPSVPTGMNGTACFINYDVTPRAFVCNAKPTDNVSTSLRCDNTYVSSVDGTIKQCNPNTNISTPIDGAIGSKMVDGELTITCKVGYSIDYMPNLSIGSTNIGYDTVTCVPNVVKEPEPVIVIDNTTGDTKTINPDGSIVLKKIDGTIINTDSKGISTTTYTNGSTSIVGSYGTASGGTTSSSRITGFDTPTESGIIGATDYIPSLVSTTCSSSTLTLEQKTLCEINQGIKNQNSETSPRNSVNNLLRDINIDNNSAYAAINQNLKYTNDNFELLNKNAIASNINTNSLNQTGMSIKNGVDTMNTTLKSIDENLKKDSEKSDKISEGVDNALFNETDTKGIFDSMSNTLDSMIDNTREFFENITFSFENAKNNYQYMQDFIEGKKTEYHSLYLHAVQLPISNLTIFGKTQQFTCFFNQDLYSLFSTIRPFITFILNIYFAYLSIRIFLNFVFNFQRN
jgi:hypothetical protein